MPDQEIIIEGDAGFVPKASPSDAGKVLGVLNSSGDVGWVVDQSGTFIQVQADWAETDSSQPSYIDHKPDLSVYATASSVETALAGKQDTISDLSEIRSGASAGATAVQPSALESYATTSAMNTALAGKQDTISDLATIRSGAAAGATAVQPSALESYATTSAMNTALAGKQDVINDLATIRSGAALGATAAQPSDLPSSDELVPSASSGDAGKVLTVDSNGDPSWQTPASVTVDQTYNASSTHAQSGTAVAGAIAGVKQVPASTSADQNKVLTVNSSGNAVWQNAQTTSYTAGKGVKIANNEISADLEVVQPCLTFGSDFKFDGATQYRSTLSNNTRVSVPYNVVCKFTLPGNLPSTVQTGMNGGTLKLEIVDSNSTVIQTLKSKYYSGSYLNIPIPQDFYKDVDIPAISVNNCYLRWTWFKTSTTELTVSNFDSTAYCFVVPYSGTLALVSPLPASTSSDANKVLTVDSNGAAGWQTPATVTVDQTYNASSTNAQSGTAVAQAIASIPSSSYTAGDGIDISGSTISADFTEVQSALDFGSDFTFENPTQYTSTTADGGYMVVIPTDSATKFTLPGTLGNWPSADSGVTVQLQVGSGSTWTTLKSGNYSMLESLPSDFYTDVDIPAGMNGKYIRWFCTYTSWYQTQNVNLYIYNFDTTANCFTVPGTGTLALANPVTAGDGVEVTAGEVSVDIADTLDFVPKTVTTTYTTTPDGYQYVSLPIDLRSTVLSSTAKLTIQFPLNSFYSMDPLSKPIRIGVSDANGNKLVSSEVSLTYHQQSNRWFIDEQTVTVSCPASDWEYSSGSTVSSINRLIVIPADSNGMSTALYSTSGSGDITLTLAQPDPNKTVVTVKNPLPASAQADSGKVLKVNASGNAEWGTDGFTTTAGITDIQVVSSLPASPVATVLYLLPEA